jgi:hypothetical protein
MDPKQLTAGAGPQSLGAYLAGLPRPTHHHGGPLVTVREDDHAGHHVVIRTTYEITVDGKTLAVPLVLTNAGVLHCHALPNYQFKSAIDLVRSLIDQFPDDFPPAGGSAGEGGGHGHAHGGD